LVDSVDPGYRLLWAACDPFDNAVLESFWTAFRPSSPTATLVHASRTRHPHDDVLVGHSYGGAVISNAATGNAQVQALVYLSGWMPDEGESIQQPIESDIFEGSLVPAALRPVPFKNPEGSDGTDLYLDRDLFPEAFAGDVDPDTAAVMAATQRPWSGAAAATPSGTPGWRSVPSWFLLGTEDRAIPPAAQRFMAERAKASIEEVAASHASMVSQPETVTRLILSAVHGDKPKPAVTD
jgi:pimeloyl-ACP methyl ester carboxylesterase